MERFCIHKLCVVMIGLRIPLSKRKESGSYPWGICLRYVPLMKKVFSIAKEMKEEQK